MERRAEKAGTPAPGASLPRRSIPEGQPSVPPAGQGAWTPLSPETGRLDRWHPRLCFKGQGGTESSWEPPGGFWTVYLSAEREGTRGSMRWKGVLAKKPCVLLVSSVLPALLLSHGFGSSAPSLPGDPFPVPCLCPRLCCPWCILFLWAVAVPAGLCSLVSDLLFSASFLVLCAFCGPSLFPCHLSGFGLCRCLAHLLARLLPTCL